MDVAEQIFCMVQELENGDCGSGISVEEDHIYKSRPIGSKRSRGGDILDIILGMPDFDDMEERGRR